MLVVPLGAATLITTSGGANKTAHELLPKFGLPKGLLPGNVINYAMSKDGELIVQLSEPCYIQFSELAYYEKIITGRISYGLISNISGIQARKFLLWVAITNIVVDKENDSIQFNNGLLAEKHPSSEFNNVRPCEKWVSSRDHNNNDGSASLLGALWSIPHLGHSPFPRVSSLFLSLSTLLVQFFFQRLVWHKSRSLAASIKCENDPHQHRWEEK